MLITSSIQAVSYLRLSMVRGVGAHTGRQLVEACGSIDAVWQASSSELQQLEGIGPALERALAASQKDIAIQIAKQCQNAGILVICPDDESYPDLLNVTDDAPLILFVKGCVEALKTPHMLAMVGARKSSREGKLITRRWSGYLAKQEVCIVSGMAYGIDAAAHGGAVDVNGITVAVLGCGLLAIDERQQQQVNVITKRGCVISEYLPDITARPEYFPRRNRIIAALSQATLV
ncbi:MAG: DNA-processing protein DprA, partial [Mariprofundaceae bacterium]